MRTRYIKTVIFSSVNDVGTIEEAVNKAINKLVSEGNKIVSVTTNVYGLSPMSLIYNIIYEGDYKGKSIQAIK